MASVRFADVQSHPTEFLDFTSLTLEEFQQLVPPFEAAFQAYMAAWRPHLSQDLCPPGSTGALFGMGQSKANQWIHVLLPALRAALRTLGDAPVRSLTALAQRLGVSEAEAATVIVPLEEAPRSWSPVPLRRRHPPFCP